MLPGFLSNQEVCLIIDFSFQIKTSYIHSQNAENVFWTEKLDYNAQYPKFCFYHSFQDKIAKCRYWPVEVMRLPQPAAAKGKKVSLIPSSPLHSLFCAKIHVDKTVLGEISIKTQFSKIHVLMWILWCSLKNHNVNVFTLNLTLTLHSPRMPTQL